MSSTTLSQPSESALRAYRKWRTDNGYGAIPDDATHDTLMWCAGFDYQAPDAITESPDSWARTTP